MTQSMLGQDVVRKLSIPPRPDVVTVLYEEMSRDVPNFSRISKCISADVGLAAAMLKVANSPAMGLTQKARSVSRAIDILGLRNVSGIATGLVIRQTLGNGDGGAAMERFWDTAENTALICARLAKSVRGIPPDEAYTFGLFHDCGIPILMRHNPRYKETLAHANRCGDRSFSQIEEEEVGTHHGAVGYFLARSWLLHDSLCEAILRHHDIEVFRDAQATDAVRNLIGIVHIAENVQHTIMRSTVDVEWLKFEEAVLDHFALTSEDFINLVDDAQESLQATA